MELFFSIIIPTLNEEKLLPRLLKNLSMQKEKTFEVIVVDSSSKNKTIDRAKEFTDKLILRIYKVKKKNVSYQRNYGAKKAKGKYVFFLDADAKINTNLVRKAYNSILREKGLLFIPYILPDENKPQYKTMFAFINFWIEMSQHTNKPFSSGGVMMVERQIFNLIGGFNEKLFIAEDHELIQRAYKWGIKAKFLRTVKIKFSLRRMKSEGDLVVLYKYLLATVHILFKGKITNKIFSYKMGGCQSRLTRRNKDMVYHLKKSLSQFKKQFEVFLND